MDGSNSAARTIDGTIAKDGCYSYFCSSVLVVNNSFSLPQTNKKTKWLIDLVLVLRIAVLHHQRMIKHQLQQPMLRLPMRHQRPMPELLRPTLLPLDQVRMRSSYTLETWIMVRS